jgi:uroporphyrinogen III methyltransferase/synthase
MRGTVLEGRRVVITRAAEDAAGLARRLAELGATPVVIPAIRIEFTDPLALDAALRRLSAYDWVVFTSRNGVEAVFRRATGLTGPRVAAIGPATAAALRKRGVEPSLIPDRYVTEAIIPALGEVRGLRILLPRADIAREALAAGLRERGAVVDEVAAYRTVPAARSRPALSDVDAVTFTSSSTVRGFLQGGPVPINAKVVCIGPVTAETARAHGLTVARVAERYTEDGLVDALVAALNE